MAVGDRPHPRERRVWVLLAGQNVLAYRDHARTRLRGWEGIDARTAVGVQTHVRTLDRHKLSYGAG